MTRCHLTAGTARLSAEASGLVASTGSPYGIELRILHRLEREGKVQKGALRVIEQREVMGYPWVARTDLGRSAHESIVNAFTGLRDAKLLELLRARSYTPVTAADYADVRTEAQRLGLVGASS